MKEIREMLITFREQFLAWRAILLMVVFWSATKSAQISSQISLFVYFLYIWKLSKLPCACLSRVLRMQFFLNPFITKNGKEDVSYDNKKQQN